jgi:uncharacterized protein YqhQ
VNVSYGGQAVIEGVMMRGPRHMVLSVRGPDGEVVSLTQPLESLAQRSKFARLPVVRGAISMWESLSLGIQMLMKSAELAAPEEEQPSESALSLAVLFALVVGIGMFIALPAYVTPWLMKALRVSGKYWASSLETGLRLVLLFIYVVSISRMKEIQRVLEYHGAEHKVIWAYENNTAMVKRLIKGLQDGSEAGSESDSVSDSEGDSEGGLQGDSEGDSGAGLQGDSKGGSRGDLGGSSKDGPEGCPEAGSEAGSEYGREGCPEVGSEGSSTDSPGGVSQDRTRAAVEFLMEKAAHETTLHPRCGTSFLFIAVLVTWIVFLFVSPAGIILRVASRLALLPVIAGIAYEVLKNSSRRQGLLWDLIKAPGIGMQKLTTRQPDRSQLEVAATSLVLLILAEAESGEAAG